MKPISYWIAAVLVAAVGGAVIALTTRPQDGELPALSQTPQIEGIRLIEATPFTLLEPHTHYWRAEQPSYTQGVLLVLQTNPENLVPRQTYEHVLYVGDETAERVNVGERSGHIVAIVPGPVDLANAPIYFGAPALPEQVTAASARGELSRAMSLGVRGVGEGALNAVTAEPLVLQDSYELYLQASFAVERFAPDERDLVTGLRAPRVGR